VTRERLAAVLADPARVSELGPEEVAAALEDLAVVRAALVSRLSSVAPSPNGREHEDRLLTPEQAAARLGLTVRQVYRRAHRFPFTTRLGRRTLRFSEAGLNRWLKHNHKP